ncbi:MAG: lipoyl protein ligase domain-containing protein, partial [Acidimicrobiales bacterium]
STQSDAVVDSVRAVRQGVEVVRRRSGGGAVLVVPGDPVWVDVWVPCDDPLWSEDVARAFDWLGEVWTATLLAVGCDGVSAHRGGYVRHTRWSSLACFGGLGRGEVVASDGRKIVGVSQRRTRHGAWFHSACVLQWDPAPLLEVLALSDAERELARLELAGAVIGAGDLVSTSRIRSVDGTALVASFANALPET